MSLLKVKESSLPKYKQIVAHIEDMIASKQLLVGDKLPSLNEIKNKQSLSRDTVLTAFNELKNKGIIQSVVGKGYYVLTDEIKTTKKLFLLFDELNPFKEELYNSIISHLGADFEVDVYFHHFNEKHFQKLIQESIGHYSYYVIMPGNLKNAHVSVQVLPKENVYILDQTNSNLTEYYSVYQDFQSDLFDGLSNCLPELRKYDLLNLVVSDKQPEGFTNGFVAFCHQYGFGHRVFPDLTQKELEGGEVYIVFEDQDLIKIIKKARAKNWTSGNEFGLISYNETPLKEIIENGITTLSTDFFEMGQRLAQMIKTNSGKQIKNNFKIYKRNSL